MFAFIMEDGTTMLINNIKSFKRIEHPLTKRYSKLLVQLTIAAMGIIGIMLTQIASNDQGEPLLDNSVKQMSQKVASISQVSPLASQVNLLNILF